MAAAVAPACGLQQPSPPAPSRSSDVSVASAAGRVSNPGSACGAAATEDSPASRDVDAHGRPVLRRIRIPLALAVWQQYHDSTSTDSTSPVHIPPRKSRRKRRKKKKRANEAAVQSDDSSNIKDGSGSHAGADASEGAPGTSSQTVARSAGGGAVSGSQDAATETGQSSGMGAGATVAGDSIVNCVPGSEASAATLGKVVRRLSGGRKKGGPPPRATRHASLEGVRGHAAPACEGVATAAAPGPVVRGQVQSARAAPLGNAASTITTRQRSDTVSSSQHGTSGSTDGSAGRAEAEGRVSSAGRHSRVSSISSFGSPAAPLRCRVLCGTCPPRLTHALPPPPALIHALATLHLCSTLAIQENERYTLVSARRRKLKTCPGRYAACQSHSGAPALLTSLRIVCSCSCSRTS